MKRNGFTLLELLIATAILGFMIAGMTVALMQQQRQFNLTKETVDVDHTGRAVLNFLATEIKNSAARQGKHYSLSFVNGGAATCDSDTNNAGTVNSPPDCLTIYTWDIARGMEADPATGTTLMPSIADSIQVVSSGGSLVLRLPNIWFQSNGRFIGTNQADPEITIGLRSRINLCNPNDSVNCLLNPEYCSECGVILRGSVSDSNRTITFNSADDIVETNFPVEFNSFSDFINGVAGPDGNTYSFGNTISALTSEMSIVQSRAFRVNPQRRELQMSQNGGPFQPIAGGSTAATPEELHAPGIADLQFIFNLQNEDGSITKVGYCDDSACNCDAAFNPASPPESQSDFSCGAVEGRESDIRSVEIYVVVKSKMRPVNLGGSYFEQTIPRVGDVLERTVDSPSELNEPEEGFIYRIHSTTVYPRNMTREDFG